MAGAITASTLTTVAVFLPLAFVTGQTGEMFRPFALTATIALLSSLFVALTIVPVLAYSPDPGPVGVVSPGETAIVARVPVRAFTNPENRLMVYRKERSRRYAGPAFLLNQMLVWGFTGQVISALLDVAGWARPWDTDDVRELDGAMALVRATSGYGEDQR